MTDDTRNLAQRGRHGAAWRMVGIGPAVLELASKPRRSVFAACVD
jgi:hypothetical protein